MKLLLENRKIAACINTCCRIIIILSQKELIQMLNNIFKWYMKPPVLLYYFVKYFLQCFIKKVTWFNFNQVLFWI